MPAGGTRVPLVSSAPQPRFDPPEGNPPSSPSSRRARYGDRHPVGKHPGYRSGSHDHPPTHDPQLNHVGHVELPQRHAGHPVASEYREGLLLDRHGRRHASPRSARARRTPPSPGSRPAPSRPTPSRRGWSGSSQGRVFAPATCARRFRWRPRCCPAPVPPASAPHDLVARFAGCPRRTSSRKARSRRYWPARCSRTDSSSRRHAANTVSRGAR